jgi:transcription elongation factor Elf1
VKKKESKSKKRKLAYLAFCDHCGDPKVIDKYVAVNYLKQNNIKSFHCNNCSKTTRIPDYLLKIIDELIELM